MLGVERRVLQLLAHGARAGEQRLPRLGARGSGQRGGSRAEVDDGRHGLVDLVLHAGQRQHVEHALAPAHDVDQLLAVAQHDLVLPLITRLAEAMSSPT